MTLTYADAVNALHAGHLQFRVNMPVPSWERVAPLDEAPGGEVWSIRLVTGGLILFLSQDVLNEYPDWFRIVTTCQSENDS